MKNTTKKLQKLVASRKTKKVVAESKDFNPYYKPKQSSTTDYYNT